ncbi:MAG: hypothetical protein HZA23_04745 [Nitrospirae bacterium]|nr:hypothetical protein [Nitrospirota bacterium]
MEPVAREERAVRSLRGQMTVEVIEDGVTRWVFDGGIVVEPGRLRFQTFAPGGWLVGDLLLEGKQGRLYLPSEQTLLVGSPRNLASVVPSIPFARFPPDLLWKTLLGVKGEIARDADEEGEILVEYEEFRDVNGRRVPWQIAYHLPEEGFTLRLTFRTLEIDPPLTEDLFHQDLPSETEFREVR